MSVHHILHVWGENVTGQNLSNNTVIVIRVHLNIEFVLPILNYRLTVCVAYSQASAGYGMIQEKFQA